jgi:RNA polymerase sigma factor (TIGR02999 family)
LIPADDPTELMTRDSSHHAGSDSRPAEDLDALLYGELRALAADFLRRERSDHTLQPTALVHEAWIRLSAQAGSPWDDRAQFFAIAAQAMRRILIDHARRRRADKRGGGRQRITLASDITPPLDSSGVDLLALDEALDRLAALDARQARVVELRFFAGLTVDEVAEALSVSARTVASEWRLARAWLSRALDAGEDPA